MAKVGFTKLTSVKDAGIKTITVNGQEIEVKQYLPVDNKSQLITEAMTEILDSKGVSSPLRTMIYTKLYIIKYYTNINFTDNMINNAGKTYDLLLVNNIFDQVEKAIPESELDLITSLINQTVTTISHYRTSTMGVLDYMQDARETNIQDVESIKQQLQELSNNPTLTGVLEKLG